MQCYPPFRLIIFSVVPFNTIPPLSKNLIIFVVSFISFFVSAIPKSSIFEIFSLALSIPLLAKNLNKYFPDLGLSLFFIYYLVSF